MLKLKLQYSGHLMRRADSLEKILMLAKIEGRRRRGQQRLRWLDGIIDSVEMSLSRSRSWWWTGRPGVLWSVGLWRVGHKWATELNWTDIWLKLDVCKLLSNVSGKSMCGGQEREKRVAMISTWDKMLTIKWIWIKNMQELSLQFLHLFYKREIISKLSFFKSTLHIIIRGKQV